MTFPKILGGNKKKESPFRDPPKKQAHHVREESTESLDESEVEYGPGWEAVFDISPANVTEQRMKQT